jgi:superoxide reductase
MSLGEYLQTADWKTEKHAPDIECADVVKAGEKFMVSLEIGKEIPHPNTTEHHIEWIELYFKPESEKFAHLVGKFSFDGHGASIKGANEGPLYTEPSVDVAVKVKESGTLMAMSFCNIHGLWEASKEIKAE